VGRVFFPLDEELGLLAGSLAPRQQEHLVHLSSHLPFAQASQMMERLLGVQVSKETARRVTEQVGGDVEAAQTAEAEAPFHEDPAAPTTPCRLALSADGALVPLVNGEWAEVRTLAIGEVVEEHTALGTHEVHVDHLSYFSRLTDAQTFADLAEGEMRRRHVVDAKEVCAVTDGADWLQGLIDLHRADAVRILDFPHAPSTWPNCWKPPNTPGWAFRLTCSPAVCIFSSIEARPCFCAWPTVCQSGSANRMAFGSIWATCASEKP
jgi:hypothetical protein